MSAIVYMATNLINGKRYIGATVKTLRNRQQSHVSAALRQSTRSIFHAAIRKHGEVLFRWELLKSCVDYSTAMKVEIDLIARLKPEYNMTFGGEGTLGLPGPFKGEKRLPETMAKIWTTKRERNSHRSERVRAGARAANKIIAKMRSVPVICIDDGTEFPSVSAAADFYGVTGINISLVCRRLLPSIGSRRFAFQKTSKEIVRGPRPAGKPILCIDDGTMFSSTVEAAAHYGLITQNIYGVLHGRRKTCGGRRFEFASVP